MVEAPWGKSNDIERYLKWRNNYVTKARTWAEGNIALFLGNRLTFQRGTRGLEIENHKPWSNPESALIDTYFVLRSEEGNLWTEEESVRIQKIMAAFVSETFPQLLRGNEPFWTDPVYNPIENFFGRQAGVTLEKDEYQALVNILHRVGRDIDTDARWFSKPLAPELH